MKIYKIAQTSQTVQMKITPTSSFSSTIPITMGELLSLDKFLDYGTNSRVVREIVLRIIRQYEETIRVYKERNELV